MTANIDISGLCFIKSTAEDEQRGLLGWVSLIVCDTLHLDGIALRRTMEGRLVPTWFAKSETVPKASSVGSANTAFAIRRSVGVSSPLAAATRSNVEVSGA